MAPIRRGALGATAPTTHAVTLSLPRLNPGHGHRCPAPTIAAPEIASPSAGLMCLATAKGPALVASSKQSELDGADAQVEEILVSGNDCGSATSTGIHAHVRGHIQPAAGGRHTQSKSAEPTAEDTQPRVGRTSAALLASRARLRADAVGLTRAIGSCHSWHALSDLLNDASAGDDTKAGSNRHTNGNAVHGVSAAAADAAAPHLASPHTAAMRLNATHASAAASRLVHLADPSLVGHRSDVAAFISATLLPLLEYHMLALSPRQLANAGWALARLAYVPPGFWCVASMEFLG